MELGLRKDLPVLVVGLGTSGLAAVRLLRAWGFVTAVCDRRPAAEMEPLRAELAALGVETFAFGAHEAAFCNRFQQVVVSPGVPLAQPVFAELKQRGARIIGELELAAAGVDFPLLAVTGTNGKSTVVTAFGEVFRAAGIPAFVGGNLGRPACEMVAGDFQAGILELSSFQLEAVHNFRPHLALILNLTPDHQDRYADAAAYLRAKSAIAARQGRDDYFLYNADDPALAGLGGELAAAAAAGAESPRVLAFSCQKRPLWGAAWLDDEISWRLPGAAGAVIAGSLPAFATRLPGEHNRSNLLAVFLGALAWGLEIPVISRALAAFKGLAHRLEAVGMVDGCACFNDSKATNLDAVIKAIGSFSQPLVLLLGGYDKGADFAALKAYLPPNLRALIAFGKAATTIKEQLPGLVSASAPDLSGAFSRARELAVAGDVILLAPGCASFDEFANYRERGRYFRELVAAAAAEGRG